MKWSFLASIPGHNLLPNKQASFSITHPHIFLSMYDLTVLLPTLQNLRLGGKGRETFKSTTNAIQMLKRKMKCGGERCFWSLFAYGHLLTSCQSNLSFPKVNTE